MNSRYNLRNYPAVKYWMQIIFLCIFAGLQFSSHAEPYLAIKNNLQCSGCHVNPNGGGQRNEFGRIYGASILAESTSKLNAAEFGKLNKYIDLGANARFNAMIQRNKQQENNTSKSFEISSAQVYLHLKVPETGLSFYLDQQVAPGSAINREAFVMYQFENADFIKAGKIFLPYGLRIEDDSAFIRQATGMNFDNSDNGIEYGSNFGNTHVNVYISNGTSQASNNDDSFLFGTRIEHHFSSFRIGTSALLNDGDQETQMLNLYGGSQLGDFTLLAEVDYIRIESQNGNTISQLATLAEINYQWRAGWNIKLTAEYFDPDNDIEENEQTRYSVIGEYTPLSNVQLRFGIRSKQDIPQKLQQNNDLFFIQSHFYF